MRTSRFEDEFEGYFNRRRKNKREKISKTILNHQDTKGTKKG